MKQKLSKLFLILATAGSAFAESWTGPLDGNFNFGVNWNTGNVPGPNDSAEFLESATAVLSGTETAEVDRLLTNGESTVNLTVDGDLSLRTGSLAEYRVSNNSTLNIDGSGNLLTTGSGTLRLRINANSTLNLLDVNLNANSLNVALDSGGLVNLTDGSITNAASVSLTGAGATLALNGIASIDGPLVLENGSNLSLNGSSNVSVTSVSATTSGGGSNWVFDVTGASSTTPLLTADTLDITNISLDLSSTTSFPSQVILAEYDVGGLTGTTFNGTITGLPSSHFIDYNFGPNGNQIALVVPEPSMALPILAGFLPLLGFRRRSRR